jgi:hypothetical protein
MSNIELMTLKSPSPFIVKHCPFCGSTSIAIRGELSDTERCPAEVRGSDLAALVKSWNTRVIPGGA